MGRILPFAPPARAPRRPRPAAGEALGRILLFTGVRYERGSEPPRPSAGEGGPRRRRRRGV
jgi:hypothetical protein